MPDVINLDDHRPHTARYIVCMECAHDWVAVAPVGVVALECPQCAKLNGEEINYQNIDWFNRFMGVKMDKSERMKRTLVLLNAKRMGL